ncbi:OST-HTH/LOTUS domain-containing protein [Paraburkholderia sp. A2WS-5]|uniref:OST-HTH/LOTUS domain-containing protein n=1 Tax=Paraburkholderia sp. A2WS-5 TaxID=3028372 RepID=UPI003B81E127
MIKVLLVNHEITAEIDKLTQAQAQRAEEFATNTLGVLVKKLRGSFLVTGETHSPLPERENADPHVPSLSYKIALQMSAADHAQVAGGLDALVSSRNQLVHHFIDQFNLGSIDDCAAAQTHLSEYFARVDGHCDRLQHWATEVNNAMRSMLDAMQTPAFLDLLIDGIEPDGTIHWVMAGIVCALREAATELAIDGWTRLDDAVGFVAERYPAHTPGKYGCRTWKQVLHDSRLFELRYRANGGDSRSAWFKERGG